MTEPRTPNVVGHFADLLPEHERVLKQVLSINSPNPEIPIESIMAVALQRSRHLVEAYFLLFQAKNLTAASALIRMQLDSVMRVNACFLVSDPLDLWNALRAGEPWKNVRAKNNSELTDTYLHRQLSSKFEWASRVYQDMSGYIHLSRPHLQSTVTGERFLGMSIRHGPASEGVTDRDLSGNMDTFTTVTRGLLSICEDYATSRQRGSTWR
jgi:hypothetical protein